MDRSSLKKIFPGGWGAGGGGFSATKNQSCWKLHEMDRSSVKKFSLILGGGGTFLPQKPKLLEIAENCMKWAIGSFSASKVAGNCKIFPVQQLGGGGLFCHKNQNQSCWKLHEMDRSSLKNFPFVTWLLWGGGFSASWNQSCWKLHEMDRSSLKKFPSSLGWGGAFLPQKPKLLEIAWNG